MNCPFCGNRTKFVYCKVSGGRTEKFEDVESKYHRHNNNIITCFFNCSKCGKIERTTQTKCWCGWGLGVRWNLTDQG